jgi:hypothetical protein
VPVIASGGVGTLDHLVEGIRDGHATAVLAASIFHFGTYTIGEAKDTWPPLDMRRTASHRDNARDPHDRVSPLPISKRSSPHAPG